MENFCNRREIADGVYFTSITDSKFKINRISVIFITDLSENAAVNAVVPRMLSKNSAAYPTISALNRRLSELYSASLNWSVRADGDLQFCELNISVISDRFALDGEKILRESLEILIGCMFEPVLENGSFPVQSLELEKQNQIDDNNAEINDKGHYAYIKAYEAAFKGEPAEIQWGGKNEEVERITCGSAYDAYRSIIETMRTEIICVGESSFEGISDIFADAFSKIKRRPEKYTATKVSAAKPEPYRFTEKLDVEQSKLVMFFKTPLRKKYPLMVMQYLYGGTESSKLFLNVREKMSLCYYCYSRLGYAKGFVTTECGVDADNLEKAEKECINQLSEIANGNFTDEEVANIKLDIKNSMLMSRDTVTGLTSLCLSGIIYPENAIPVEEMTEKVNAVTREEIIEAAKSLTLDTVFTLTCEGGADDE